jgi:hypothetical protein
VVHAEQKVQSVVVKRMQLQPDEAIAERMFDRNGLDKRDYNGTNPLKSVLVADRWSVLTHLRPLIVVESPVKLRPVNNVATQFSAWRAWIGAPTSAAVAIAALRQMAAIVERSFMLVLLWSLGRVMSSSTLDTTN